MTKPIRRPPLKMPLRYEVMRLVREQMPSGEHTDAEFAALCSQRVGQPVSASTITNYREQFGIPKYTPPTAAQLRAKVRELQLQLDLAVAEGQAP